MKSIQVILALFLLTQLAGLWVGVTMVNASLTTPEIAELNVSPAGDSGSILNSAIFLGYILVGAVAIVLILKFYKGDMLFRLIEAMTLFVASSIVFYVILLYFEVPLAILFAGLASATVTAVKFFTRKMKNAAAVLASMGVGAVFGFSLDMLPASLFVIGLAVYDFVAVYLTGHMVYMAKELGKRKLAFSVSATESVYSEEKKKEEKSTLELGTGDMAIPLMLAVSAYKFSYNVMDSLAITFGALLGLVFVLEYVTRKRTFMPALPPIIFGALACFAIAKTLITGW